MIWSMTWFVVLWGGAINNEYDTVYDISSLHYGLTWDKAVSKNGDVKIQEDPTTSK